jgi:hypothetical protein
MLLQQLEGDRRDDIEALKRKEDLKKAKSKQDKGEIQVLLYYSVCDTITKV